jgi:hypothetical protein
MQSSSASLNSFRALFASEEKRSETCIGSAGFTTEENCPQVMCILWNRLGSVPHGPLKGQS